jgi:hypothetical protein
VAHIVRFRLDDAACARITQLRTRVVDLVAGTDRAALAGTDRPTVTVAAATVVPPAARAALATELRVPTLPSLWLATLGTVAGRPHELVLAAVVDTELLAVHTAVHDALAGRVRGPVGDYLPGSWLPHCVLAAGDPAAAFARLHPVPAVRARVTGVEIHDTVTGTTEPVVG